jgi:hypothetical protein
MVITTSLFTVCCSPLAKWIRAHKECMMLGARFVQRVIDSLNDCFPDLSMSNAIKKISPMPYLFDDLDMGQMMETWMALLVPHFQWRFELVD